MKILCETHVINRRAPHIKVKTEKSTLAVGFHPPNKNNSELFIIHFTPRNKCGTRYKVKENLEKIFSKFINDGKTTISFKEPEHDLQIKCDPIQLKAFMQTLKLGLENKTEMSKLGMSTLASTPISKRHHPITKLIVSKQSDFPIKGFARTLKTLIITGIGCMRFHSQISSLKNLTVLDLNDNKICHVPKEIGNLNLTRINFSRNQLGCSVKKSEWSWLEGESIKKSLCELDISDNGLKMFPYPVVKLRNLKNLNLNNNEIKRLPFAIRRLSSLKYLHVSSNKLASLPQNINRISLDILDVWGNNFLPKQIQNVNLSNIETKRLPTLWELAGQVILTRNIRVSPAIIPWLLVDILLETPVCACGIMCFSAEIHERATILSLDNLKDLIFSRDRVIHADCVFCSIKCANKCI